MPWLIQSDDIPLERHLFFVHVPRCGGTSLMQHFDVPSKVMDGRSVLGKLFMNIFFRRYHVLESANFPIFTIENGICLLLLLLSVALHYSGVTLPTFIETPISIYIGITAIFLSFFLTFICTAPTIGRIGFIHRWYLWFVHYPLLRAMESIEWCTGTNKHGYIMHLTAGKLLGYGYVEPEQMDNMCSLAIVRNPFTRMVSIYGYNRFGEWESFPAFVKRWNRLMAHYIESGELEEWFTPCHVIPQFEYTHYNGKQLVQSVVKQEELKYLKTKDGAEEAIRQDSSVADLPELVRDALLGMPHTNARPTSRKWYEYYDQESLNLTYEMYKIDFIIFGYDSEIKERPDLNPPMPGRRAEFSAGKYDRFSRDSFRKDGVRQSRAELFSSVRNSVIGGGSSLAPLTDSEIRAQNEKLLGYFMQAVQEESIEEFEGKSRVSNNGTSSDLKTNETGKSAGMKKDD